MKMLYDSFGFAPKGYLASLARVYRFTLRKFGVMMEYQ